MAAERVSGYVAEDQNLAAKGWLQHS